MSTLAGEPRETTIDRRALLRNLLVTPLGLFLAQRSLMPLRIFL